MGRHAMLALQGTPSNEVRPIVSASKTSHFSDAVRRCFFRIFSSSTGRPDFGPSAARPHNGLRQLDKAARLFFPQPVTQRRQGRRPSLRVGTRDVGVSKHRSDVGRGSLSGESR